MFQDERLDIAESLATTEPEEDALAYANRVASGEYEFNSFAESRGYESQMDKINFAQSYEDILTHEQQPVNSAEDYIPGIIAEMRFDDDIAINSFNTLEQAKNLGIFGVQKDEGLAAASVYIGMYIEQSSQGEISTQQDIAEVAEVTHTTLRRYFKRIENEMHGGGDFEFSWLE